jgi:Copper resistance protein K
MRPSTASNEQVGKLSPAGWKDLHLCNILKLEIKMLKKLAIMATLLAAASTTFAIDIANVAKKFDLKDGSFVYVLKDGKMAMEDRLGRPVGMKAGHVMETKDGQKIIMIGNELARLEAIKNTERPSN